MEVFKSFVIGSSAPVFIPFMAAVKAIPERKFDDCDYPALASMYFGGMNTMSWMIGKSFELTLFQRLFVINIISIILVASWITYYESYDFKSPERWFLQYLLIALGHTIAYLGIIYTLETVMSNRKS